MNETVNDDKIFIMQIEQGGPGGDDNTINMDEFRADVERSNEIQEGIREIAEYRRPTNKVELRARLDPTDPRYQELLDKAEAERRDLEGGDERGSKKDKDKDLYYAESSYIRFYGGLEKLGTMDERVEEAIAKAEKDAKKELVKKENEIRKQAKAEDELRLKFEEATKEAKERLDEKQKEIRENSITEKKEIREQLGVDKERINQVQLRLMEDALEENLLRFRSTYPYDGRMVGMFHDSLKKSINATRREEWAKDKEITAWLDSVVLDLDWGENNFKVLEGVGTILPQFFSGMNMLNWVREKFRTDPVAGFYQHTFAKEIPGLTVDKAAVPEVGVEVMRERAIKFQDDATFWKIAVAEVQQMNITGGRIEASMMKDEGGNVLSGAEIKLLQLVFGESDESKWLNYEGLKTPESILNWFAMGGSLEEKNRYVALMEAMLVLGIKDKMVGADEAKTKELATSVLEYAENRLANWNSDKKSLEERLADVVIESGIVMSWGHMEAGRMGWGWEYEKDDITGEIKRNRTAGGTTVATDISTPRYWLATEASNAKKCWTRGMMPPMSPRFVEAASDRAYGWQPSADETMRTIERDASQVKMWDRLWKTNPGEVIDDKTREMREKLQKMVWFIETPYKGKNEEPLIIPMFFPAEVKSLSFWETIRLKPKIDANDKDEKVPSVWQEATNGGKMSEIKWEKMGDQALYRWMITISQTLKLLTVMNEPQKKLNGDQFYDFFASPGALRELIKRGDLGVRDEDEKAVLLTMGLLPMLAAFKVASDNGVYDGILYPRDLSDTIQIWTEKVSGWLPAFEDLAKDKGGFKGYREMMKKMYVYYVSVLTEIGLAAGTEEARRSAGAYTELRNVMGNDLGVKISERTIGNPKFPTSR